MPHSKEIGIIILSLFLLSFFSGFVYGEHKYGAKSYRENYIMRDAKVYAQQNQIIIQIGCNPHHPLVKLNFDHYDAELYSQSDYLNYVAHNTLSKSTITLDPTIVAEVLAGFMGGKKIPDLIASLNPLDDQRKKIGEAVSSVLAVYFGFDAGEWTAQQLSNSCSREAVYETALRKSFWKRLKLYVIKIYLKEYYACQPPPFQKKSLSDYLFLKRAGVFHDPYDSAFFGQYYFGGYPSGQGISRQELFFPGVPWIDDGKYLRSVTKRFEHNQIEDIDSNLNWSTIKYALHEFENNLSNYQKHVESEHPLIKTAYSEVRFIRKNDKSLVSLISIRHTQIIHLVNYINVNCSRVNGNLVWSPSSRRTRSRASRRHN